MDCPVGDWNVFSLTASMSFGATRQALQVMGSASLLGGGTAGGLELVSATTTATGLLICTYRPIAR
jgi:hypothetical protein